MDSLPEEQHISAGVIPYCNNGKHTKFLLIQHDTHDQHWAFPKGHQEPGETLAQTALRELAEETGIDDCELVTDTQFTESYSYHFEPKNIIVHKTVHYFLGQVAEQTVLVQAGEVLDYQWLPYEEALQTITFDNARQVLVEAYRYLSQ
jgi:bis(5'-nucleosidyl)-tetraphosphatase